MRGLGKAKKSRKWTRVAVERTYRAVAAFVAARDEEPLALLQREIARLDGRATEMQQLQRFAFVRAALAYHGEHGGLTPRAAEQLFELGLAILQANGIA